MNLPEPMTATQIADVFYAAGINMPRFKDRSYSIPSLEWAADIFPGIFRAWLEENGLLNYEDDENDCDNFSEYARTRALIEHHNTPEHVHKTSLAWGWSEYNRDKGDRHEINTIIVRDPNPRIVFWEPQNVIYRVSPIITLSDSERGSVECEI